MTNLTDMSTPPRATQERKAILVTGIHIVTDWNACSEQKSIKEAQANQCLSGLWDFICASNSFRKFLEKSGHTLHLFYVIG